MDTASPSASISLLGSSVSSTALTRQSSEFSLHINDDASPLLDIAIKNIDLILSNQTKALSVLTSQYRNSMWSISQMKTSLRLLNNSLNSGGKIIISGMGKSFKIASKTVATLNSLRMHSALLHPSEALHGDLGMIREDHSDSIIIISASGNSPELLQMLDHTPLSVPIILMTCNKNSTLSKHPKVISLLLAEIPTSLSETNLYGLSAPTISTTLCLTMLDAVSIALSELHIKDYNTRKNMFGIHHPGGAIGINYQLEKLKLDKIQGLDNSDSNLNYNSGNKNDNNSDYGNQNDNDHDNDKDLDNNKDSTNFKNEDFQIDNLSINGLVFIKKLKDSKFKKKLNTLPESELEFLRMITLNDYVITQGIPALQKFHTYNPLQGPQEINIVLDCETARDIYRESHLSSDPWDETRWKIIATCIPYPM
jgi:D-arabinose 5-phosphate isomerase GutQ